MSVNEKTATADWLTLSEATALLQCTVWSLGIMVEKGMVRRRTTPGHRRYWREDVERLAAPPPAA